METKIFELADKLTALRARKEETERMLKEINSEIERLDFALSEQMALSEELGGLDANFERIKIPSGGSLIFEVPGDNPDEPEAVREFSGVILFHHVLNAYYETDYTGGNQPPDCGSLDGVAGVGNPGGPCADCWLNEFGTGKNGAKACKNKRRIFLLREGEIFPQIISLPTGSLKELTRYLKRLLSRGLRSNMVLTRFSLKKASNSTGLFYSQALFAMERVLTPEESAVIGKLSEQVKTLSRSVGFDADGEDSAPPVDPETGEVAEPL